MLYLYNTYHIVQFPKMLIHKIIKERQFWVAFILLSGISIYSIIWSYISIERYYSLSAYVYDSGLEFQRMWAILRNQGTAVNQKTVRKVLKDNKLNLPTSKHRGRTKTRNLFHPHGPDQLWQTDITYDVLPLLLGHL